MKALLADIELDVQELKCIIDALSRDKNPVLCSVAKRNVLRMRRGLDQLLNELDTISLVDSHEEATLSKDKCLNNIDSAVAEPVDLNSKFAGKSISKEENCKSVLIEQTNEFKNIAVKDDKDLSNTDASDKINSVEVGCQSDPVEQSPVTQLREFYKSDSASILADKLKPSDDLRRSISLNDSFRFSRVLFNGDDEKMNRVLQQVGAMSSLTAALAFLEAETDKHGDDETLIDLQEIVKKYFL